MQARGGGEEPAADQGEGGPGQQPHRARGGARRGLVFYYSQYQYLLWLLALLYTSAV